jgi:2-iminobutanoate/2-iminopropanoate deaminase
MKKEVIATEKAPKAIGPYSQGMRVGDFILTAGQAGVDPQTGKMAGEDIAAQTRRTLENIAAILEAGGSSMDKVVKTTVFLADMNDFAAMNKVYAEFFPTDPPARTTVAAARLPLGALVEIEAVAVVG